MHVFLILFQLHSYNRHTLVADPYEDGFDDLLLKKQKVFELDKKVGNTGNTPQLQARLINHEYQLRCSQPIIPVSQQH